MEFGKKVLLATITYIIGFGSVLAGNVDHFQVTLSPDTAKVGEALDLTIEAVDKNNKTVSDYNGMILIFSESDPEAELPITLEDNTYTYKSTDQGKILFENAIKFSKEGTQNINVYDFNDDTIFGIGEATITKGTDSVTSNIEIVSPENGLTIGVNKIKVSGTTEKNHQVQIIVNGKNTLNAASNSEGVYEKEVTGLVDGENIFLAKVLDADGKIIGESKEVKIKVEKNSISLTNVKVTPEEVDSEGQFEIEVLTTPALREVNVTINDIVTKLEETKEGTYTAKIFAPKDEGTYKIDIIMKDELGHEQKELGAASIKVNKVELKSADPTLVPEVKSDKKDLKITGLKLVELKTKSILTWDKVDGAESYNVYKKMEDNNLELITNVLEPKFELEITGDEVKYEYFAVKAMAKTGSGEVYEGDLSEATKIKTGPEMLILLLISIFSAGLYLVSKQKRA
ncbi:MAG: hypothetical protein PHH98_02910 [Candidatus Gracilibacteria bacterium]|nr:hypothetical protein [Candidatus Gracilibacteria bacterium]